MPYFPYVSSYHVNGIPNSILHCHLPVKLIYQAVQAYICGLWAFSYPKKVSAWVGICSAVTFPAKMVSRKN